jgi:hypothetical protein
MKTSEQIKAYIKANPDAIIEDVAEMFASKRKPCNAVPESRGRKAEDQEAYRRRRLDPAS